MRTLIVSDLHLGNGSQYDVFAGTQALPALLDSFVSPPTRVILNGDSVDFLMNEDPLELDVERAVGQARAIAGDPPTQAVFQALGRVLAGGGEVAIRLGNHDIEVALTEVQEVFRAALGQPPEIASRLTFEMGDAPRIIDMGGAKILVTHGEHYDPWNKVDYQKLLARSGYSYAAGSMLVKQLMNPMKRVYGLRFADLLKPDFQGGTLTAFAVAPEAAKLVLQKASVKIAWQLFHGMNEPASFLDNDDELGISARIREAGLTEEEAAAMEALMSDGPTAFSEGDDDAGKGVLSRAALKLARAGLEAYARFQRKVTGTAGATYFELEPDANEWKEALRLAKKFEASAVIMGHTHAARWKDEGGVAFANTGTWIWLMELPSVDASAEDWTDFLLELRSNPRLDASKAKRAKLVARFTAALVEPAKGGGATFSLVEWDQEAGALRSLGSSRIPPR